MEFRTRDDRLLCTDSQRTEPETAIDHNDESEINDDTGKMAIDFDIRANCNFSVARKEKSHDKPLRKNRVKVTAHGIDEKKL